MICPKCKKGSLRTQDSRDSDKDYKSGSIPSGVKAFMAKHKAVVWRRRTCTKCHHQVETLEMALRSFFNVSVSDLSAVLTRQLRRKLKVRPGKDYASLFLIEAMSLFAKDNSHPFPQYSTLIDAESESQLCVSAVEDILDKWGANLVYRSGSGAKSRWVVFKPADLTGP